MPDTLSTARSGRLLRELGRIMGHGLTRPFPARAGKLAVRAWAGSDLILRDLAVAIGLAHRRRRDRGSCRVILRSPAPLSGDFSGSPTARFGRSFAIL
jgi:hypothetical protein